MLVIPRDFPFEPGQLLQGMFCMVTAGSLETDVHVRLLPHHHPYPFWLKRFGSSHSKPILRTVSY